MDAIKLLKEIVNKGGIIGQSGKLYLENEVLAGSYIIECSFHLERQAMKKFWGKKLIEKIARFKKKHEN
jgi:hypothetical protein